MFYEHRGYEGQNTSGSIPASMTDREFLSRRPNYLKSLLEEQSSELNPFIQENKMTARQLSAFQEEMQEDMSYDHTRQRSLKDVFLIEKSDPQTGDTGQIYLCIRYSVLARVKWASNFACIKILCDMIDEEWGAKYDFIPDDYRALIIPANCNPKPILEAAVGILKGTGLLTKNKELWSVYTLKKETSGEH